MKRNILLLIYILAFLVAKAEDGYRLWLRYAPISNATLLTEYRNSITGIQIPGNSEILTTAREELVAGLESMLGEKIVSNSNSSSRIILAGTPVSSTAIAASAAQDKSFQEKLKLAGKEGFVISTQNGKIMIAANSDAGVLYGVFHFLRLLQTNQALKNISQVSSPRIRHRLLNHWDNLDRSVERGYAGASIWDWHRLPHYIDPRYKDYARANASIGINGTVLTNVNANASILTQEYLEKVATLANVFRSYGIKVYLTARFSAPVEIGGLKTADPLDPQVQNWWKLKADTIYRYIPDFGGFLVKANSEGQPGPQNYNRTHADGANMLADAVAPHGGIVMWRAFVYSNEKNADRFKQAYDEFKPLDGKFRKNVIVQVKNGPIDFQPREPFHPLFGATPQTPLMMEFQITQEYLGFATHLVFLSSLFKEVLQADTYAKGAASTVSKVVDGSLYSHELSGMAGVANIGSDRNWTGHLFGQANWYAFGRLAWDHTNTSSTIAEEWTRQTFGNNRTLVDTVKKILLQSHEILVNYMTPLGLHHIMGYGHHYGPAPWYNRAAREDWNPVYFHKADSLGIGFDRTAAGSNALAQYFPAAADRWKDIKTCPEEYLLWFHHVPWDFKMRSGKTFWQELCYKYDTGAEAMKQVRKSWGAVKHLIDSERYEHVNMLLSIQEQEAAWWRNSCLLYFQTFSKMDFPKGYEKPSHSLEHYKSLRFPYAPGN